jgi:hypothetical protein
MYAAQQTDQWKQRYKIRSGIEAMMSELKRGHGMGKLRVRRAAKVCFAIECKVIICNIKRWAKVYKDTDTCNTLKSYLKLFINRLGAFIAVVKETSPAGLYLQITRSWQFQIVAGEKDVLISQESVI